MKTPFSFRLRRPARAFSLIEILVVVGLLSLIILGLVIMFGQTQRAYRLGMTQVDVLEGGRMFTDMTTRELAQMRATGVSTGVNFYAELALNAPGGFQFSTQDLPGNPTPGRTNLLEELFFVTRENQTWTGIGYVVLTNPPNTAFWQRPWGGLGTLYRSERTNYYPGSLYRDYFNTPYTNLSRVLENVVHFKVRAYDPAGRWLTNFSQLRSNATIRPLDASVYTQSEVELYRMTNNVLPASVELELGILEPRTAERVKAISDPTARATYLAQQAGKVHVFRWRVPVRNVDPTAYQ